MSKIKSNQHMNKIGPSYRKTWHQSLVDYFVFIKNKEDKIDSIRSALLSQKNFSPKMLFQYIDNENKNNITLNDLISFLNGSNMNFKEEYLRKFIRNFDKDNDFCLNYKEFMGIILPLKDKDQLLQNNFLSEFESNINYKYVDLDEIVKKIFCSLLAEEMDLITGCNKIIGEILGYNGFTPYEAFLDIVNSNERYINENNLAYFLTRNNIEIKEEEIHQLMFRLDMDNDGKISYEEFQNMFLPLNKSTITTIQSENSMKNNIKKEFDDININLYNNINNYNSSQQKNSNNSNFSSNKYNNSLFGEDISPIRNETSNAQTQTKRDINNINRDINSEGNFNSNSNILFDSLEECSKNQESLNATNRSNFNNMFINSNNNTKYKFKNKVNALNKGIKRCHHHNCFRDNKSKKFDIDIYENMDNKIKKIFQIPKNKIIHRSVTKKEENKEKENNSKSPKVSYTKVPLNFDYSNYSNDIDKILLNKKVEIPKRNNSMRNINNCVNIINQEINYITNDNNNKNNNNKNNQLSINNEVDKTPSQKHFVRLKKEHNIPFSASRNKSSDFLFKNNYHSFRQKSSLDNNSLNRNSNETTYSSKKNITNNLFKNTFITYHNSNNNDTNNDNNNNNDNDINTQNKFENNDNSQNAQSNDKDTHMKKPFNLQNLILNSPIHEKKRDDNINMNDNIQIFEKKLLIVKKKIAEIKDQQNLYNQKFAGSQNRNINKNFIENDDEKNIKHNSNKSVQVNKHFATEIKSNEVYNLSNYELSSSILSKPSQTNFENNDKTNFDKKGYNFNYSNKNLMKNSNSFNNPMSIGKNNINKIELNNNYTKYVINNCVNKMDVGEGKNKINYNLYNKNRNNKNNNNIIKINTYEGNQMRANRKTEPIPSQGYYHNSNEKIDTDTLTIFQEANSEQIQNERFNNLYNLLYDFLKWELIIENIKQSLCSQEDINTNFIFEIFDTKKRNLISISDIVKALNYLGMRVNVDDIKFIFLKNNKRIKDKYKYNEFCELILPNNAEKRNEMNKRVLNLNYMNELSDKTKKLICLLFQKIIEGERSNEIYRNMLAIVPNSSGFDLFNLMKKNYAAGICKKDIDTFLSSRGKVYSSNETDLIMKKLDKNKDGVVDYTEFLTEITPKVIF